MSDTPSIAVPSKPSAPVAPVNPLKDLLGCSLAVRLAGRKRVEANMALQAARKDALSKKK